MNILLGPRKTGGYIFSDGQEVAKTIACCHCGKHFVSVVGSGKRRGWCLRCSSTTCGHEDCMDCIPFEERLDVYEKPSRLASSKYATEITNLLQKGASLL